MPVTRYLVIMLFNTALLFSVGQSFSCLLSSCVSGGDVTFQREDNSRVINVMCNIIIYNNTHQAANNTNVNNNGARTDASTVTLSLCQLKMYNQYSGWFYSVLATKSYVASQTRRQI